MRELVGELWGPVGLVVDVSLRGVERDSNEYSKGSNLRKRRRDQLQPRTPTTIWDTLEVATACSER